MSSTQTSVRREEKRRGVERRGERDGVGRRNRGTPPSSVSCLQAGPCSPSQSMKEVSLTVHLTHSGFLLPRQHGDLVPAPAFAPAVPSAQTLFCPSHTRSFSLWSVFWPQRSSNCLVTCSVLAMRRKTRNCVSCSLLLPQQIPQDDSNVYSPLTPIKKTGHNLLAKDPLPFSSWKNRALQTLESNLSNHSIFLQGKLRLRA